MSRKADTEQANSDTLTRSPWKMTKFHEAAAPLFITSKAKTISDDRIYVLTQTLCRIMREMYLRTPLKRAIEFVLLPAIDYYPKIDLNISQQWSCYSKKDVMGRLIASLRFLKYSVASVQNVAKIGRAAFELAIKQNWGLQVDTEFISNLKETAGEMEIKLELSVFLLQGHFMFLSSSCEDKISRVENAVWGCMLTSGIIFLGQLVDNKSWRDAIQLRACLHWLMNPNLINIEYIKQSDIDLNVHWWFKSNRKTLKRRRPTCDDSSDSDRESEDNS